MSIDYMTVFVPAALVTAIGLAVVATRRVWRDVSFTADQRRAQLWLIWLLPIVGAALVLAILRDEPSVDSQLPPPTSQTRG